MEELVIIYVLGGIIDRVKVVHRADLELDSKYLDRVIRMAEEIAAKSTAKGFDPEEDTLAIFSIDSGTGEAHEVWAMGVQDERA